MGSLYRETRYCSAVKMLASRSLRRRGFAVSKSLFWRFARPSARRPQRTAAIAGNRSVLKYVARGVGRPARAKAAVNVDRV